jgi:MurNAc alpha-1-phosphate uridylyltransferase
MKKIAHHVPTQAFIFAAGRGERMMPLTDSTPKPLVKIKNKPILDYIIETLDQIPSIKKIIINGFHLAEKIEAHIKKLNNPKIIFSNEPKKLETGGGLVFAKDKIDFNEPLLLINGDVLWQDKAGEISDIEALFRAWNPDECDILLGLKKRDEYFGYEGNEHGGGDFNLIGDALLRFPDYPMTHVFVGLQIINPKILKNPPEECFSMSHFYRAAVGEGGLVHRIKGIELNGKYFHIGTVRAIKIAEENI